MKSLEVSIKEEIDLLPNTAMLLEVIDIRSFPKVSGWINQITFADTYGKPTSATPVHKDTLFEFLDHSLVPQVQRESEPDSEPMNPV